MPGIAAGSRCLERFALSESMSSDYSPLCVASANVLCAASSDEHKRRMRSGSLEERALPSSTWSNETTLYYAVRLAEASKIAHDATVAARAAVAEAGGDAGALPPSLFPSPRLRESPGETTPRAPPARTLTSPASMSVSPPPALTGRVPQRALPHQRPIRSFQSFGAQQPPRRCSSLAEAALRSSETVMSARFQRATGAPMPPPAMSSAAPARRAAPPAPPAPPPRFVASSAARMAKQEDARRDAAPMHCDEVGEGGELVGPAAHAGAPQGPDGHIMVG